MKANGAPEKIYLDIEPNLDDCTWHLTNPNGDSVEYIRTDAFIEKVCDFLKSYRQDTLDGNGYIAGIVNDKTIEDFRKYMEE